MDAVVVLLILGAVGLGVLVVRLWREYRETLSRITANDTVSSIAAAQSKFPDAI